MAEEPWDLVIGIVSAPFGRIGELKVKPLTDFPERFPKLKKVCLRSGESEEFFEVEKARLHKGMALLKLRGIDSIDDADRYRGYEVTLRHGDRIRLPKDSFYIDDIIGLEVVTTEGESLGTVTEVLRAGANDVYVTREAMVPAVREIVKRIDLENKKIIVEPVEGLRTG